jgi:hypothetical protein
MISYSTLDDTTPNIYVILKLDGTTIYQSPYEGQYGSTVNSTGSDYDMNKTIDLINANSGQKLEIFYKSDSTVGIDYRFFKLILKKITNTDDYINRVNLQDLYNISTTAPTDGQALVWNDSDNEWKPGTVASSGVGTITPVTNYLHGRYSISFNANYNFEDLTDTNYNTEISIIKDSNFNKLLVLVQIAVGYSHTNFFAGIILNKQIDNNSPTVIVNNDGNANVNDTFLDASMGNSSQVSATKQLHGHVLDDVSSVSNGSTIKYYLSANIRYSSSQASSVLYFGGPGNTADANRYSSPTVITIIPQI